MIILAIFDLPSAIPNLIVKDSRELHQLELTLVLYSRLNKFFP